MSASILSPLLITRDVTGVAGTVTSVSVAAANGFTATVATATTTPAITIIAGAITPSSVTSAGAISGTTITATGVVTVPAGTAGAPAIVSTTGTADTGIWFPAADTVAASTAGVERLRVDSSGNVGIGTTTPSYKLSVSTSGAEDISGWFSSTGTGSPMGINVSCTGAATQNIGAYIRATGALNNFGLFLDSTPAAAGNWSFYNNSAAQSYFAGNVGIGTTAPEAKLDIAATGDGVALLRFSSERAWSFRQYGTGAGSHLELYDTTGGKNFIINTAGNVGIGTTSPLVKLDVDGPILCKSYTVATVPAAATAAGQLIYVTDAAGGATHCSSNGSVWKLTGTQTTLT